MKIILLVTFYFFQVSILLLFFRCAKYESKAVCTYLKAMNVRGKFLLDKIVESEKISSNRIYSSSVISSFDRTFLFEKYLMSDAKLQELKLSSEDTELVVNNIRPGLKERISILKHMRYTVLLGVICLGVAVGLWLR